MQNQYSDSASRNHLTQSSLKYLAWWATQIRNRNISFYKSFTLDPMLTQDEIDLGILSLLEKQYNLPDDVFPIFSSVEERLKILRLKKYLTQKNIDPASYTTIKYVAKVILGIDDMPIRITVSKGGVLDFILDTVLTTKFTADTLYTMHLPSRLKNTSSLYSLDFILDTILQNNKTTSTDIFEKYIRKILPLYATISFVYDL
jgi:hypothetical protein